MSGTSTFYEGGGDDAAPPPPTQENVQRKADRKKIEELQGEVAKVTGIMEQNLELILERDGKLNVLDNRADALNIKASEFGKQAGKLKRKYWWKNCKVLAILIGLGLVVIVIILVWAISKEQ